MDNIKSPPPFFDIYSKVWKSCLKLWPLFPAQFLFLILQYAILLLIFSIICGPFIARNHDQIAEGFSDPLNYDWIPILSNLVSTLKDPVWIATAIGVLLLFGTLWMIFSAISDGGLFRTFWKYFRSGEVFSWNSFFREGFQWMVPMLWLQFFLSLWILGPLVVWALLMCLLLGLALLGVTPALILVALALLGVFFIIFWVVFGFGFTVFCFLSKAYLTKGMAPRAAMRAAFTKIKADRWRVGQGLLVAFLGYVGVSFFLRMILRVLSLIPVLGILFFLLDMVTGIALTLLMIIFLSGLSVAYLQDEVPA